MLIVDRVTGLMFEVMPANIDEKMGHVREIVTGQ